MKEINDLMTLNIESYETNIFILEFLSKKSTQSLLNLYLTRIRERSNRNKL